MTSANAARPASAVAESEPREDCQVGRLDGPPIKQNRVTAQRLIAAVDTDYSHQVRVFLYAWRGEHKLELRPYSATVPQVFMPCDAGVTVPIEKLGALLDAVVAAEREAIERGLL